MKLSFEKKNDTIHCTPKSITIFLRELDYTTKIN